MNRIVNCAFIAAAAALLPSGRVAAQNNVGYVCAFGYNVYDKIAWVGRNIVRVEWPESNSYTPGYMADLVNADFRTRMRGTYSQDDFNVTNRVSVDGYFGQYTSGHSSASEARNACLSLIEDHRRQGYDVNGLGAPLFNGRDNLSVQHLGFLSALEFPNYIPGTVAARARQRESSAESSSGTSGSSGASTSSGPRWVNGRCIGTWWECETPEQARERIRRQREASVARAKQLVIDADALYERRDFRGARDVYFRVANYPSYTEIREQQDHARERMDYIDRNLGALEYANMVEATGMSFGFSMSQSALRADQSGLITALVKKETFGLPVVYSWGSSTFTLNSALSGEGTTGVAGEFTRYTLGVNTTIPKLRLGSFGIHVGYQFQKTDRRDLHLATTGISFGGDGVPLMRFDVTPVYGKLFFGGAFVLDVSEVF